jgi:uncharacterized OsmC-like protein
LEEKICKVEGFLETKKREEHVRARRIGDISQDLDEKTISRALERSNWVCPYCKALNPREETTCHQCKRPLS